MRGILDELDRWRDAGLRAVLARVVEVEGSGPRAPGAAMAVCETGEVAGSVSGGCVEGAVVDEAMALFDSGERKVVAFGYTDDEAFAVGLTCGGTVRLFLEEIDWTDLLHFLAAAVRAGEPTGLATVIAGPLAGAKLLVAPGGDVRGTLGDADLDRVVARDVAGELASGTNAVRHHGPHGEARAAEVTVFIESFVTPPRMLIFGAVDFTGALVRAGKLLGFRVTVCDARSVFATSQRFSEADEVIVDWPHRLLERTGESLDGRDAVCVLTHDHKFDVPAIRAALATGVGYIGAMGSRRTHAARVELLRAEGVTDEQLCRVRAPIGLDLGARTPEETAVSICAEIIASRGRRSGSALRDGTGPIH